MVNPRKKKVYRRLYLAYASGALLTYCLLMLMVMPWWNISNMSVLLTIDADPAETIHLSYSDKEEPLPLVPLGDPASENEQWVTELPPRPDYDLSLIFPDGSPGNIVLRSIEVIRLSPDQERSTSTFLDLPASPSDNVQVKRLPNGVRVFAEPGGSLTFNLELAAWTPYQWLSSWGRATFGFVLVALVLFFALATGALFPDRVQAYRRRTPAWESLVLLVCIVVAALAHLHLVRHSMPEFTPGKSDAYLRQALDLHEGSVSASSMSRPGYPLFLETVGARSDWDMAQVTLIQGVLFCISLGALGFSMLRLVRAPALGPFLILAGLSPPALWASRHIGIESLTASSWLLCLAVFLFAWKREGWQRWLGFLLFGLAMVVAKLVCHSALLLLVLPLGLLFGTLIWTVVIRGVAFWRLEVFWRTFGQVFIPVLLLILLFIWMEAPFRGVESESASAAYTSEMFEVPALLGTEAYESVVRERAQNDYRFGGPAMEAVPNLASSSARLLPWQATFVAWGRLSLWNLFLPDDVTVSGHPLRKDYRLTNRYLSARKAKQVQDSLTKIMRDTGQLVQVPEVRSNQQIVAYNATFLQIYEWFYRILLVLALAGWMIGLLDRKLLAAGLVLPFMLNVLLQTFALSVGSEAIQSMDALLWMGALAGLLCTNPKAMQRSTDESDRRTMRPIRPQRLFTRHEEVTNFPAD